MKVLVNRNKTKHQISDLKGGDTFYENNGSGVLYMMLSYTAYEKEKFGVYNDQRICCALEDGTTMVFNDHHPVTPVPCVVTEDEDVDRI